VLLAGLLSLALMGSEFDGCGGGARVPDRRALPMATGGCWIDADCGTDACFALACVAGECVSAGPRADADGDGFPPSPCGDDCNDGDANVFPGAAERCDGRDQDCDGTTDEDAPGVGTLTSIEGLVDAEIVTSGDAFVVIGRGLSGELAGLVLEGPDSVPVALFTPELPEVVELTSAASDGERIVVALAIGGDAQRLEIAREGSALIALSPPTSLGASGVATALDVHLFGGQDWIALDTADAEEPQRWLWRSGDGATLTPFAAGMVGPRMADDGASLVLASGEAQLDFLAADGSSIASQTLPGSFATGLPIASGTGEIVAAYRDSFDHNLIGVTASATRSPSAAPFGARADAVSVRRLSEGVLVMRASPSGLSAWILAPDLRTYLAAFTPSDLSTVGGSPDRVSAATNASGTSAILSAYGSTSVAAILSCDTAP
jgi:hypothetical protein